MVLCMVHPKSELVFLVDWLVDTCLLHHAVGQRDRHFQREVLCSGFTWSYQWCLYGSLYAASTIAGSILCSQIHLFPLCRGTAQKVTPIS